MRLFDPPESPAPENDEAEQNRRDARKGVVVLCAGVAFTYGLFAGGARDAGPLVARALGVALGTMFVPALVAWAVSRSSENWHYAFAAAFAVVFGLAVLASSR